MFIHCLVLLPLLMCVLLLILVLLWSTYCHFLELRADLSKGSFRHFSSFCVIKISKRLNFQDLVCSYNRVELLQAKAQTVLIKLSDTYNVCCHGNSCAYGLHTSFKTGYLISNRMFVCGLFVQSMQLHTHQIYRNMVHS